MGCNGNPRQSNRGGRGGRGNRNNSGRGSGNSNSKTTTTPAKKQYIFAPHSSSRTNTATFASVSEHIADRIQKTYQNGHDIAKSLRDGKLLDLTQDKPKQDIATHADEKTQKTMQDGFDLKYQALITLHTTRVQVLQANLAKAYALIMDDYCTKAMRNCIQEHPDFASKIQDNPIVLLETIKSCLHEPVRAQYPLISLVDHLVALLTCKQQPDEQLIEWSK